MLTVEIKNEVITYLLNYSKGLIEDDSCPHTIRAFDAGEVSSAELEIYVEALREELLKPTAGPRVAINAGVVIIALRGQNEWIDPYGGTFTQDEQERLTDLAKLGGVSYPVRIGNRDLHDLRVSIVFP